MTAEQWCLLAAGVFFSSGLLTGVWKYRAMSRSPDAQAPVYVDISHRTSLMYAFSALLLREFVPYSPLSASATVWAVGIPLLFFAAAITTYLVHGLLGDTDNQLKRPHMLGRRQLPAWLLQAFMLALIVGEIGGFAILFVGFLRSVWA